MKRKLFLVGSLVMLTLMIAFISYLFIILFGNYAIDEEQLQFNETSVIVDQSGEPISKLFIENRDVVTIEQIPEHIKHAFVAVEDVRFYEHHGFDLRAIGRALYRDILAGAKVEGGSTLTQQLVKNVYLSNEKSWLRKTKEVLIAINVERRYSKDEILTMYLNSIYFGHGNYGIQTASQYFFNKDVDELTLEEGAMLASIPKGPYHYSPVVDREKSEERRNLVLALMAQHEFITEKDKEKHQAMEINLDIQESEEQQAYYTYLDMVIAEASEKYNITSEELLTNGYQIVTPIDRTFQKQAYDVIQEESYYPQGSEDAESAFVLMDTETGGVLAVQGGKEYVRLGLNRVNVKRQPGSTFKPLSVYTPVMEKGDYHPYSLVDDVETTFAGGYAPKNAGGIYRGEITMYEALMHSSNVPAVWLLNDIGIDTSLDYLQKFGFEIDERQLGIALGGLNEGVTPFELTKAYRAFAAEGKIIDPYFIEKIYDSDGHVIAENKSVEKEIMSRQTAWDMTRMLESVVEEGTGTAGFSKNSLAGKTGTTSFEGVTGGTRDAWFVGYNQEVVGAMWLGYDRTTEDSYLTGGSSYPTKMFKDIINGAPSHFQQVAWRVPNAVNDLEPPVKLPEVNDLVAIQSFGGEGLVSVALSWSASEDRRVQYRVYEVDGEERNLLSTVVGGSFYYQPKLNIFSTSHYEVVPYDSLTHQEGTRSNIAASEFKFGFH